MSNDPVVSVMTEDRGENGVPLTPSPSAVAASLSEAQRWAFQLWALLDDIDTLDDACRADDAAFREHVWAVQRKRFAIMSGEEWERLAAKGYDRA